MKIDPLSHARSSWKIIEAFDHHDQRQPGRRDSMSASIRIADVSMAVFYLLRAAQS